MVIGTIGSVVNVSVREGDGDGDGVVLEAETVEMIFVYMRNCLFGLSLRKVW